MPKKRGKRLFMPDILLRGIKYYCTDMVRSLQEKNGVYTALVRGSEDYVVQLTVKDGEIKKMSCNCPFVLQPRYTTKKNVLKFMNCKHMAAVVCAVWDEQDGAPDWQSSSVSALSAADIKPLLRKSNGKGHSLADCTQVIFSPLVGAKKLQVLKKQAVAMLAKHTDNRYFLNGHQRIFERELAAFLRSSRNLLVQCKSPAAALELTLYVYMLLQAQFHDDKGAAENSYDICGASLNRIVKLMQPEEKSRAFELICSLHNSKLVSYTEKVRFKLWLYVMFKEEAFLQRILKMFRESISSYLAENELKLYITICADIMNRLHYKWEDLRSFWHQYWKYSSVRMMAVNCALRADEPLRAIAVLKESKWLDLHDKSLIQIYSSELIKLYMKLGMDKELKDELIFYLTSFFQSDFALAEKLRMLCSDEEWHYYYGVIRQHNHI